MQFLTALINLVRRDDEGQGLAEYALILALIAIVAIIALIFLGTQVSGILSTVGCVRDLARDLAARGTSCQLLPVVLAHSYSRPAPAQC
jgi:pilus assembly protein Flp/PilA